VRLNLDIVDVALNIDTAIPCGLIITELVSNAFKHAFPGPRPGEVTVSFRTEQQGSYRLAVRDNGIGLAPSFDPRQTRSLGLQLVTSLAGQLRGTLAVSSEAGSAFTIQFQELPSR
jgi:two-component sensor histidine kinase